MASKVLSFLFVILAVFSSTYAKPAAKPGVLAAAPVVPVATSYSAQVVNHAVTAPVVAAAPAAYVASPYIASPYVASPYLASPYSAYYAGLPATYVL